MRPIMTRLYLIIMNVNIMTLKFDKQHVESFMDIKQAMHACLLSLSFKALMR